MLQPTDTMAYRCYDNDDDCYYSAWDSWARWLVLGLIILAAILLFFAFR